MLTARSKHLARKQRTNGMWDSVVHVEEVEAVEVGYLSHTCSEGKIVRGIFEEGVGGDRDLVKVDIGLASSKAKRLG